MAFGANDGSLKVGNGFNGNGSKENVKDGDVNGVEQSKTQFLIRQLPILHPSLKLKGEGEIPNPEKLGLEEELPGWHGYVEWEKYPERKRKVKEFMEKFEFPSVSLRGSHDHLVLREDGTMKLTWEIFRPRNFNLFLSQIRTQSWRV